MLPEIVNYLLTLERPGGGWLVYRGGYQVIIPAVPPNTEVSYTVTPLNAFAWLGWATRFGTDMVPNAFTGYIHQYGTTSYTGTLTQRIRDDAFDYFIVVTESQPTIVSVTNVTALNQRCEVIGDFLVISNEDDWELCLEALRRIYTSVKSERLAEEANRLLSAMVAGPRPPIGGK